MTGFNKKKPVFESVIVQGSVIEHEFQDFVWVSDEEGDIAPDQTVSLAERQYLRKYAELEYAARELAYKDLPADKVVGLVDENGENQDYRAIRLHTSNNIGFVPQILVPFSGDVKKIHITFRGTDFKKWNSAKRDLEYGGAGANSFAEDRASLLQQINTVLSDFKTKHGIEGQALTLAISGHSLGSADAQNCFTEILDVLSTADLKDGQEIPSLLRDGFSAVGNVELGTFNSAGVTSENAKRCEIAARRLAEKRELGLTTVEVACYNQRVHNDPVQQSGQDHVLRNVPGNVAKVDVLKIQDKSMGWLDRLKIASHTFKLQKPGHDKSTVPTVEWQSFSNSTLEGQKQVNHKLRKSFILNSIQYLLSFLGIGIAHKKSDTAVERAYGDMILDGNAAEKELLTFGNHGPTFVPSYDKALAFATAPEARKPFQEAGIELEQKKGLFSRILGR